MYRDLGFGWGAMLMIDAIKRAQGVARQAANPVSIALLAGIGLSLFVQAWLVFVQEFNWDEFYFLGLVHEYLRGELAKALQTIHVHPFALLAKLRGTEIDQLIVARLVMLAFEAATFASLYALARTWAAEGPSLLALLAFATMPVTLQHGASFRADPIALALLMAALALLARAPLRPMVVAAIALLLAIAGLVTVKIIFFAPAFAGVAAWRIVTSEDRRATVRRLGAVAVLTIAAFAALYLLHQATMPDAELSNSERMIAHAGRTTLLDAGLLPRRHFLVQAVMGAPFQTLMILASIIGLCIAIAQCEAEERWRAVAILGCAAPLGCLLFYRNAFPYFLPFITAPAFVAVAWFVERREWSSMILATFGAAMAATGLLSIPRIAARGQGAQRAVVAAVHAVFPEPVSAIDRNSMIATFPKRGFFMSTWGMLGYQKRGPIFAKILERTPAPLLILNSPTLEAAVGLRNDVPPQMLLQDQDRRTLRENYIPHWGPLWVAGKRIRLGGRERTMPILIPGPYTLEHLPVALDGTKMSPGETISLTRGMHRISSDRPGIATFRWGNHLPRPTAAPPTAPLFNGF